jgi:hypothetical protein
MTDEQTVRLAREVLEQWLTDKLSDKDAMGAMSLVLGPGKLTYEQVAIEVRCRVAHLGD